MPGVGLDSRIVKARPQMQMIILNYGNAINPRHKFKAMSIRVYTDAILYFQKVRMIEYPYLKACVLCFGGTIDVLFWSKKKIQQGHSRVYLPWSNFFLLSIGFL